MSEVEGRFTTSFGKTINFVPGFIEYIDSTIGLPKTASEDFVHASINAAGGHNNLNYEEVNKRFEYSREDLSLRGYAARLGRLYQFLDLLDNTWLRPPFERHLDIGCGFGIQPRILRALGVVENTTGIDVYDRCSSINEDNLKKQHRRLKWLKLLEPIRRHAESVPYGSRTDFRHAVIEKVLAPLNPRHRFKKYGGWMPDRDFYNQKFVSEPKLDRFIQGNVFDVKEKFNLITTFTSFEWFEAKTIFKHVSEMLEDGGVFYIWVSNWWSDVNVTRLSGHFPYACQRLTKEDYFRYLDECLPEHAEALKGTYEWFDPSHPTLSDYIEIGYDNGLIALDHKAYGRPHEFTTHTGPSPLGHLKLDGGILSRVLEDIHDFRPDVRLTDLLPFTHAIIFQKIDKEAKGGSEELQRAAKQADFHYRPPNGMMRKIRDLAVKLHPDYGDPKSNS